MIAQGRHGAVEAEGRAEGAGIRGLRSENMGRGGRMLLLRRVGAGGPPAAPEGGGEPQEPQSPRHPARKKDKSTAEG